MGVVVRTEGDVSIVEMSGEFTLGKGVSGVSRPLDLFGHRLQDLGHTLSELLGAGRHRIVLDMHKVRFIDSAGLGDLVAWKKRTMEVGGDVRLLRPRDRVRELFALTTLASVFQIFEDEAEAVASFR